MMGKMINAPKPIWNKVNLVWVVFLIGLGFLNLYVAFNYSLDAWVNFKLFGVTGMMFVFIIAQTVVLRKYLIEPTEDNAVDEKPVDEKPVDEKMD